MDEKEGIGRNGSRDLLSDPGYEIQRHGHPCELLAVLPYIDKVIS
jgi:hypothetical protein